MKFEMRRAKLTIGISSPHSLDDEAIDQILIPAIRLKTLQGRVILNTPEMVFQSGQAYAFIGPSGSGKSLFLRSLFGWTTENLAATLKPKHGHFYLLQDPSQGLTPGLTIGHHFQELGLGPNWRDMVEPIIKILDLNLDRLFERKSHSFSGGERQRLMMAMVLVQRPGWLVCDEPAASLDDITQKALWEYLFQLKKEQGLTLLIATHRLHLIKHQIDHLFTFSNGEIASPFDQELAKKPTSLFLTPLGCDEKKSYKHVLSAHKLKIQWRDKILLDCPEFRLEPSQANWLTGVSGSGKTSFVKVLAGLRPEQQVTLQLGAEPLPLDFNQRSRQQKRAIGFLFQHGTQSLNPHRSLATQLQEAYTLFPTDLKQMLMALRLDHLNLSPTPDHFSVGELQRFNLIRILGQRPQYLLADELLAPLDAIDQVAVLSLLALCQQHWQMGILIIGHDLSHHPLLPGEVLCIRDGCLAPVAG